MKVALISPSWRNENSYPPLGLAYIGSVLENNGHKVRIFDLTLDQNVSLESKLEEIIRSSPDIVGISSMSHNYTEALYSAKYIKYNSSNKPQIVFGGPHPTIMSENVLLNDFIDFVIMGEGEDTFLKLSQNLEKRQFKGIEGLCYKDNGNRIIIQPKNKYIENLDNIPFPARHLLKLDNYKLFDDYGERMSTIVSSRGCPYMCTFCYKGLFGVSYRQRSPKNIIDEIKECSNRYGYKSFYFIDDLFTMNIKRVEELTNAIRQEKLNIRWQCLARVNNATYEMFESMKDAGCYKVHFGIESGNQRILNNIRKGITLEQVRNAVKYCKNTGIRTKGYFMIGMPGDSTETMQDTINFANELKLDDSMFSILTPFPGTELWNGIDKSKIASLSDAFYYSCDSDDVNIFYNLSNATDYEILEIVKRARKITRDNNVKTLCKRKFGDQLGPLVWQLSKIDIFKRIGKCILKV